MKFKWTVTGGGVLEFNAEDLAFADEHEQSIEDLALESAHISVVEDQEFEIILDKIVEKIES